MISHFNRVEIMRAKLKQQMKINIILESLIESFNDCKVNYNMIKKELTLTLLMHELQSAKYSFKKLDKANHVESSSKLNR